MDVHIAIEKLGKNNNQYTVKADGSGIDEWRSSEAQPTQSELDKAWSDYQTAQAAIKYKSDRAAEYPSVVDQLDDIYHNGIDAWKATIKTTKDKYPKP